jgi:hypothetical protein
MPDALFPGRRTPAWISGVIVSRALRVSANQARMLEGRRENKIAREC